MLYSVKVPSGKGPKKRSRASAWFEAEKNSSWLPAVQLLAKDWRNLSLLLLEQILVQSCEAFSKCDWDDAVVYTQLCIQLLNVHLSQSLAISQCKTSEGLAEILLASLLRAMRLAAAEIHRSNGAAEVKVQLPLTMSLEVDADAAKSSAGGGAQCRAVEIFTELAKV